MYSYLSRFGCNIQTEAEAFTVRKKKKNGVKI